MASPAIRSHALAPLGTWPVVVDTSALANDVLRRCRQANATGLLEAAENHAVRIFASEHVARELARHLPAMAIERGIDPGHALKIWNSTYAPVVWFVSVPTIALDPKSAALAARDATDLPTAFLAQLVDGAVLLTEDRDLLDIGFGSAPWLDTVLALRDIGRYQGGLVSVSFGSNLITFGLAAGARSVVRHPWLGGLGIAVGLAGALSAAWRGWLPSRPAMLAALAQLSRLVTDAHMRYEQATKTIAATKLSAESELDSDLRAVVSVLARITAPMSTASLVQATSLSPDRVRDVLTEPLFVAVGGERWMLGRRLTLTRRRQPARSARRPALPTAP